MDTLKWLSLGLMTMAFAFIFRRDNVREAAQRDRHEGDGSPRCLIIHSLYVSAALGVRLYPTAAE